MKTINFLTSHYIPENTACTNRILAFVSELEKNYKVNVITLTEKGKKPLEEVTKFSENTDIYYVNQKASNDKNFLLRAYYEIVYIYKLVKISNSIPSNLVIATTPYMFMIPVVGFGIKGKKILDIRDLVWEYIAQKSFSKKMIKIVFKFIMKQSIKRFDQIIVTNDREKKLLEEKYIAYKIDIVPNGISFDKYEMLSNIDNKLSTHPFTVTYLGNIGFAHNLLILVKVAKKLPNVKFTIIGDGMELGDIKAYADQQNINNIEFTGKLDWSDIKPYYESSSVLYAQLQERLPSAMPSKLFEYASTGLPIIYGGTGHAVSFVEKLEHSIVIQPDNEDALKMAIEEMLRMSASISNENRILVKKSYLRETSAENFSQIVGQTIDNKD